jgi:hypothetical protein
VYNGLMQNARTTLTAVLLFALIGCTVPISFAQAAVANWQQKGVSFYPHSSGDFDTNGFRANVDHFKSLGMDTVTLVVQIYQSNQWSTDIQPGGNTPTDASLVSAIQYAHSKGLKVMLKMHLDLYNGYWRANINPSDRNTWYGNYLAQLQHYGQIAQANNAEFYCLGTELIDMASSVQNSDNTGRWQYMISQVRQIYHGQLTYDANWGSDTNAGEARYIQFWPQLDFIGVSAYYPLSGDGSVAQNENSWAGWENNELLSLHNTFNKPIVFTEVGYRSVTNAYQAPFNSWSGGSYDPQGQVNDYQALFDFWNNRPYMQGIDVWYEDNNQYGGGSGNTDYLVLNKPVEQTLSSWWASSAGAGTTTPAAAPAFTISGTANPTSVAPGQPVTFTANVADTGGPGWGTNVDLEVYDSSSHQMAQRIYNNQNFTAGQSQSFTLNWTPQSAGTYTFKAGVFGSNWNLYTWNDNVAQESVGANSTPPPPPPATSTPPSNTGGGTSTTTPPSNTGTGTTTPPSNTGGSTTPAPGQTTNIWWPTNGATISGLQPFKAMLENVALSAYQMFWQVDNGVLNQMFDSQTDYPHKEAMVDVSGWRWNNNGPYTLNFLSKDNNGTVISQKPTTINVAH